jgi:hypothetical protein
MVRTYDEGRDWSAVNRGVNNGQIGRPPKAGRTRDVSVKVALTQDELEDVRSLAKEAGFAAMTDYLRSLIRADARARGVEVLQERTPSV